MPISYEPLNLNEYFLLVRTRSIKERAFAPEACVALD